MSIELREAQSVPPVMRGHNGKPSAGELACKAAAKSRTGIACAVLGTETECKNFVLKVQNFIRKHGLQGEYTAMKRGKSAYIVQKRGKR